MTDKPLILSTKVLILDDERRILVIQRSMASKGNPGKWDFPGGKIDPGETLEQGLLREVAEETGLCIRLGRVLGATESESPARRIAYLILEAHLVSGEVKLSDEHDVFRWVTPGELASVDLTHQFAAFALDYARTATDRS
jgi:8-oxo-dGTP diphosphatase